MEIHHQQQKAIYEQSFHETKFETNFIVRPLIVCLSWRDLKFWICEKLCKKQLLVACGQQNFILSLKLAF